MHAHAAPCAGIRQVKITGGDTRGAARREGISKGRLVVIIRIPPSMSLIRRDMLARHGVLTLHLEVKLRKISAPPQYARKDALAHTPAIGPLGIDDETEVLEVQKAVGFVLGHIGWH